MSDRLSQTGSQGSGTSSTLGALELIVLCIQAALGGSLFHVGGSLFAKGLGEFPLKLSSGRRIAVLQAKANDQTCIQRSSSGAARTCSFAFYSLKPAIFQCNCWCASKVRTQLFRRHLHDRRFSGVHRRVRARLMQVLLAPGLTQADLLRFRRSAVTSHAITSNAFTGHAITSNAFTSSAFTSSAITGVGANTWRTTNTSRPNASLNNSCRYSYSSYSRCDT